jgi:hypothetical protein
LGKYKEFTQRKILTIWDDETTLIAKQKFIIQAVSSKIIENEIENKSRRVIAKRGIRKRQRKFWEQFLSHLQFDI